MSIKLNIPKLTLDEQKVIKNSLIIDGKKSKYQLNTPVFRAFSINHLKNTLSVPLYFGFTHLNRHFAESTNEKHQKFAEGPKGDKISIELNEIQKSIEHESLQILQSQHSLLLSLFTGAGKTYFAIYLATKLGYKTTAVLCHRNILIKQWRESIKAILPNAIVSDTDNANDKSDFILCSMMGLTFEKAAKFSKYVGCVIVDECHVMATESFIRSIFCFEPKYLIGLSATPQRSDGFDNVLKLFFGSNYIIRKCQREVKVIKIKTDFSYEIEKTSTEKHLNWTAILKQQAQNEDRNKLIVNEAIKWVKNDNRKILIACRFCEQCASLYDQLRLLNAKVTKFWGGDKIYDENADIMITTFSKGSVGMDNKKLNMLIIASDIVDGIEQLVGRVTRSANSEAILIDIVDDFFLMQKHWNVRQAIYKDMNFKFVQSSSESMLFG